MSDLLNQFGRPIKDLNEELETLKLRYEFLKGVYEAENQRRRTVEQKASLLIGSLSMMGAVIVGVANFYSGDTPSQVSFYIVFYTASLAISLCFTLYYAIRTLKKRTLTLMDTNDQENIIGSKAFFYENDRKSFHLHREEQNHYQLQS